MTVRAVFFDVGETLIHPHPSFPELFSQILAEEGHDVDPGLLKEGLALVSRRFSEAAQAGELWSISAERSRAFWLSIYRLMFERLGVTEDERLPERLYTAFTDLANYRLFEDVTPTLELLRAAGLTLAVISNFEEWVEGLLDSLDVKRFFDVRVISGVEGVEKPDPRIFQMGLERTGVRAEDSVHVGDSPEFDAAPAAALGMLPVLIDRRERHPGYRGIRIGSLAALPGALGLKP